MPQSSVAQALATDYFCIYYVNVDDNRFIEYSSSPEYREFNLPTSGDDIINFARTNFEEIIYEDDQTMFLETFTKEAIIDSLNQHGTFTMSFRLMFKNVPTHVHLKITRMIEDEAHHVVIGISEDYLPHIFESFTREEKTTVNTVQGTGLGLAITARVVDLMGGTISVKSKQGEGSEFTVELDPESREGTEEVTETGSETVDLTGCRVLLVEDNIVNAEIAAMLPEQYGVITEHAENGQMGYEKVREAEEGYYDAVLMDIQMPIMDGYESTAAIRSLEGKYYQSLPIIAMSANAYDEDVKACLKAGMNAHVAKPFKPEDLIEELHQRIRR